MANVIFKVGTRAQYDALATKDINTLYWLTDVLELRKGDALYGCGAEATNLASGLMSAADKAKLDGLSNGTALALTPVDNTVVITDSENGKTIGVKISAEAANALTVKDDGLFVTQTIGTPNPEQFTIDENGILNLTSLDASNVRYNGEVLSDVLARINEAITWGEMA